MSSTSSSSPSSPATAKPMADEVPLTPPSLVRQIGLEDGEIDEATEKFMLGGAADDTPSIMDGEESDKQQEPPAPSKPKKKTTKKRKSPSTSTTSSTTTKKKSEEKKEEGETPKTSIRDKKQALKEEQTRLQRSVVPRLVDWLLGQGVDIQPLMASFWTHVDEEIARIGLKTPIPFGRYKGQSYDSVWKTIHGREYLEWAVRQEWCYEDTKETVKALKDYYKSPPEPEKKNKASKKKKKAKKKKTSSSA